MNFKEIVHYPVTIEGVSAQIGTANELAIALDVLQGHYDRETLAQLRPHLAAIIANATGFMTVMRSLSVEDQIYLIEAIGSDLAGVIQKATRLRDQLATMAYVEVEEVLLKTLGAQGLRSLIVTAQELAEVLEWVYGQCDDLMLELLGLEYIRKLCRQAIDLSAILRGLDQALQEKLVEELGWSFITGLIDDGRDLAYFLRALPPASSERLLQHYSSEQLRDLIGNAQDWAYLCQRLEPEEARFLFDLLELH